MASIIRVRHHLSIYALLVTLLSTTNFDVPQVLAFQSLQKVPTPRSQSPDRSIVQSLKDPTVGEGEVPCGDTSCQSRKTFLNQAWSCLVVPTAVSGFVNPNVVNAATPVTPQETDSIGAIVKRKFRTKPPKLLRRKLAMDFAVLLMRSSYNALDQLDCVAMDQFQRDFFLIRRSEYEPYIGALGPGVVQQGDLTDPNYFDFISFAQYRTINREISQDPPYVFEEQQPEDQGEDQPNKFVSVVVKRDPTLTNAMLGPEHSRLVGKAILDKLEEIFGNTDSALPRIARDSKPDPEILLAALKQLVNLFLINGYAYSGDVTMSSSKKVGLGASGTTFQVTLGSPATLWGGKVLQGDGEKLNNSFLMKAATELVARAGYRTSSSIVFDGSNEEISITII